MTTNGVGISRAPSHTWAFAEADADDVNRLGGKGAGLARMTQQGLRVPPGYVVDTDACRQYLADGRMPDGLDDEIASRLRDLEAATGKTFGAGPLPLLLSVRSGAPISMPGMMDTVLNLGLGRDAAIAMASVTGDVRFMADLVARFHSMYAEIVLGALDPSSDPGEVGADEEPGDVYDRVWAACQQSLVDDGDDPVPDDPRAQLTGAVEAVFRSWNTRRARTYRDHHGIPHDLGTAVVVQSMVFGNVSDDSGSGVAFTRNPVTGEPGLFGEYLAHSQGEDVVAGTRTPDRIVDALSPELLTELRTVADDMERTQGDVLDIEFTVERSTLYLLQVRSAKRTPEAAVRIASDLHGEGVLDDAGALRAVTSAQVRHVQRPGFDDDEVAAARASGRLLTSGIGACPGQVSGALVLDPDRAKETADAGTAVVLARSVTSPADLHGMIAAAGIVTATGGSTSHAAVVARALGTTCVVGAGALSIDESSRTLKVGDRTLSEGDLVSLDGSSGELFEGTFAVATPAAATEALASLLTVAGRVAGCEVLGRVTLPSDVDAVLESGASGLVTAVDDVLAATGDLDGLVQGLLEGSSGGIEALADQVAAGLTPLLSAAGDREVGVRAIDLVADESRELLQQTAVTTRHPELSMPLGRPELVKAQVDGLARAVRDSGGRAHLALRHVSDPAEAASLHSLADGAGIGIGTYLTAPRALHGIEAIAGHGDVCWIELRTLQAAMIGLPPRQLYTAEPLDGYLSRGLFTLDPRRTIDPTTADLLVRAAATQDRVPGCRIGVRLSASASDETVAELYRMGFRRFAVDAAASRPFQLALGQAAAG
ncbi:pyruvate, phosphate dikinase [Pseudonocardia endophytica]|uniref:Pyruvate,orthophosphate dikinase n=1 Tax=Pseudonocardia endophytica TaxID=401976 RepID=A0A4R1HTC4_PSEEN|nr:pyruvate, phosphate dikinase [Pseudonocardia endophytica]TCK20662.1 pyruvate,orthophosphate dikinase [Pseudonocardia endophytica]